MLFLCVFVPAMALVLLFYKEMGYRDCLKRMALYCLVSNSILLSCCIVLYDGASVVTYIEQYTSFAVKYMLANVLLTLALCLIDRRFLGGRKVNFHIHPKIREKTEKCFFILKSEKLFFAVVIIICLCNGIFLFDNALWGDEGFSAVLIRHSLGGILEGTAADVHPPLYYLILKFMVVLFGERGCVLHLTSYLTFLCVCVLIMTYIRKKFGLISAYIAILLTGWTGMGMVYSVEIRMYSMALLFVTAAFCMAYGALKKGAWKNWILLSVFSLLAAYTHYFALLEVAFLVFGLFVAAILKKQKDVWKKIGVFTTICVVGYLPWLAAMITTLERTVENFWLQAAPTFIESMDLIFGMMDYGRILFFIWLLLLFAYAITHVISVQRGRETITVKIGDKIKNEDSMIMAWIAVWTIIGTTVFGIGFSKLVRPVMLTRYLFPMTVMAAISVGNLFSYFGKKKSLKGIMTFASVVLIMIMGVSGIKEYGYRYEKFISSKEGTEESLEILDEYVEAGYVLVSDIDHFNWTILEYYYPGKHYSYGILEGENMGIIENAVVLMSRELNADELESFRLQEYVISVEGKGKLDNTDFYIYSFVCN